MAFTIFSSPDAHPTVSDQVGSDTDSAWGLLKGISTPNCELGGGVDFGGIGMRIRSCDGEKDRDKYMAHSPHVFTAPTDRT